VQVANLVVRDPKGALPAAPLEARCQADLGDSQHIAQIRQLQLTLTPTERAPNRLALTGTVDYSKTNALTGSLKLTADALDLTRYYDLFAGDSRAAGRPAPAPAAAASDPTREPDAVNLPFRNFGLEVQLGRFYLREVDVANLLATARLDGGRLVLQPCQFTLNGAPVSATVDADLSLPGFRYDMAFQADRVPLAPLVNSFAPERKGQMGGWTTLAARLRGAGVTGAGLQKNLTGQFSLLATNLNLSIAHVRSPVLSSLINVLVAIPDLLRNPAAAVGNLVGRLAGAGAARSGWTQELTARPIDVIQVRGTAGNGRITVEAAEVRSAAFVAGAGGAIALASILTNSALQIPVHVALSRPLADQLGLVNADTPTNLAFVALPEFVTMRGTIGEPKPDINKLALAGLAARTGAGVATRLGGAAGQKAGSILDAVGTLLGGGTPAPAPVLPTSPPPALSTNVPVARPATSAPPVQPAETLLRGLGELLGGSRPAGARTNAPARPR